MRFSTLLKLYGMRVRARWATELLAVLGIAGGVALVFAALIANASLTGSIESLTSGVVGNSRLQLIARSPAGMPQQLATDTAAVEGVTASAPVLEQRINLVGPRGRVPVTLLGGDDRFASMGGQIVRRFAAPELSRVRAIAVPSPVAATIGMRPYDRITVESGSGTSSILGMPLRDDDIGALVNSPVALMPLPAAQQVTGMRGRISRVFVSTSRHDEREVTARLRSIAGTDADVRPATFDTTVFATAAYPTQQSTSMFAVLAAGVGFLFAVCAVLLTRGRRAAFVRQLYLDGHARSTILAALLLDAIVLGAAGAVAGLALGDQLSRHVLNTPPGYLATGFPLGEARVVTWRAVAISAVGALVVACAAVLLPLRATILSTKTPLTPTTPRAATRTAPFGVAALALAAAITALAPKLAIVGLMALTVALLLVLPDVLRAATAVFSRLAERIPSSIPIYASCHLRSISGATIARALAATGALAAFALVAIGGARQDLVRGLDGGARALDGNADVWVTMRGPTQPYAVSPFRFDSRLQGELRRIDGVAEVGQYRGSWLDVGDQRAWVQAPPSDAPAPVPTGQLRAGDLASATRELRTGGGVVVSEAIATTADVKVGDTLTLPTPAHLPLKVVAISNNLGWPSGTIIMNSTDYAAAWKSKTPSALQIRLQPGASSTTVAAAVRRTLADQRLPLVVQTSEQRVQLHHDAAAQGLVRLSQITLLVAIAAGLAMAAAMGGVILQRRPAIANRKVDGATTGQLWASLLLESTVLVGTGCLAGATAGLLGQVLLSRALETITGFPLHHVLAVPLAATILTAIMVVTITVLLLPGWGAARVAPNAEAPAI